MVNYNNSIIYRLICENPLITDEYIGSTINKNRRKQEHKNVCNNEIHKTHNLKVYQFIRENGGFDNWNMIVLEEYSCENRVQLCQRERFWIEERKPTLNCNIPIRIEGEMKQILKEYEKTEKRLEYKKEYRKTEIVKEYEKKYRQLDKRKEYTKKYNEEYKRQNTQKIKNYYLYQKLKNKSAIIIQKFFKKYLR